MRPGRTRKARLWDGLALLLLLGMLVALVEAPWSSHEFAWAGQPPPDGTPAAIHKIRHVVIVMQENRSFDSYFGTYPGADGIPGLAGNPGTVPCVPDPGRNRCDRPYHDASAVNYGGPHGHDNALADIAGGKMDGFVAQAEEGATSYCKAHFDDPRCSFLPARPDVMGYHDRREIPDYWAYADDFVLQDHMFQSDASWSLPEHLYLVSGWSARCTTRDDPMSCHDAVQAPANPPSGPLSTTGQEPDYAWTDLPTSCTSTTSVGAITSRRVRSPTARTTRCSARRYRRTRTLPVSGTRCRGSTRCGKTTSSATSGR
jgi:phospholipase C